MRQPMTITRSGALLVGVGVVVAVIVVWIGAYAIGSKDGEKKTLKDKGLTAGVTDPLKLDQMPVNGGLVTPEPAPRQVTPVRGTSRPTATETPSAGGSAGEITPGLNYCIVAMRLEKDAAERAAGFLTQNGLPSSAVQVVEGQWSGVNNPGSWMVVVLKGITGKEFSSRAAVRTEIEQQLSKLGQVYRKDPKGRLDFGQPSWSKRK
jgi:hypothetical protein